MSIATERGDGGQTSLLGGLRVSKADPRIEASGGIDELISALGFARSIAANAEICNLTKTIQRELFRVGSGLDTPPGGRAEPEVSDAMVDHLTEHVHRIEGMEGLLTDWSLPGEDTAAAAYDIARTVCRRAERAAIGAAGAGAIVEPNALRYLNRLSDLLWLFSRLIEREAGADSRLRQEGGSRWSRAW
jgi:cob(I)alamin adenosyltransferase